MLAERVAATELFNQEEDHILVKVYLPVAISSVCGTEQLQQAEGASHMMWTLVECN